jgi:hypothetical protein
VKEKLKDILAEYERMKLWGDVTVTYRSGEIVVVQKSVTVKETSYEHRNR